MNRDPDDDDRAAFLEAMKGVTRLRDAGRLGHTRAAPPARPRQREADDAAVLKEMMDGPLTDIGEELSYCGPGVQAGTFRKLRRGVFHVGAELDLHGLRTDEAKLAIVHLLTGSVERGIRCVRIIHGKGLRSKGDGPVLKQRLDGWLRQRNEVLAFCSARPNDGGTGAAYVLLRAR